MARAAREPSEHPPHDVRRLAAGLRTDSVALRAQAQVLRERTERLTTSMIQTLLAGEGSQRSTTGDRFRFRAGRMRAAVALARRSVRRWLESVGVDPTEAAEIALACSEACANAIQHPVRPARHGFEVEGTRTDDGIEIIVRDFGGWRSGEPTANRGRGLSMMRELMDDVEIVSDHNETRIVMRRAVPPAA